MRRQAGTYNLLGYDLFRRIDDENEFYSKRNVNLAGVPFFHLTDDLKYFLDDNCNEKYAKEKMSCIDQFYSFKIEKEESLLLFSNFVGWEKWEPVKIRHEGMEKEFNESAASS